MPTKFLLDTGIIIRELRGDVRAAALLGHLEAAGSLATSVITAFEVHRGCRSESEEAAASELFDRIETVDLTYEGARTASALMRQHAAVFGSERAAADVMIAGTAMVVGATLVTLNTRQFARISVHDLDTLVIDQESADWVAQIIT